MGLKVENKSLIIGMATGFLVAMLSFGTLWFYSENIKLEKKNAELNKLVKLQKIKDIPLTIIKQEPSEEEIVYEEYPKHDEEAEKEATNLYTKNSFPIELNAQSAKIAIIIDDIGVNASNSNYSSKNLPKEVTFSYLPYGKSTQEIIKREFQRNREAMLHLPTEPISAIDPGPNALKSDMTPEQIEQLTYHNLNQVLDYIVGVNNHMGSKFTANEKAMETTLKVIYKNKLFFLDSFTTAKTKVKEAHDIVTPELPLLKRNIFLDHKRTKDFITSQLAKAERIAKRKGYAIAIGHPHKMTTDTIVEWSKTLKDKNIQLVPITNILDLQKEIKGQ